MICPRCEGQTYDVGSCAFCGNVGHLAENGERLDLAADVQRLVGIAERVLAGEPIESFDLGECSFSSPHVNHATDEERTAHEGALAWLADRRAENSHSRPESS